MGGGGDTGMPWMISPHWQWPWGHSWDQAARAPEPPWWDPSSLSLGASLQILGVAPLLPQSPALENARLLWHQTILASLWASFTGRRIFFKPGKFGRRSVGHTGCTQLSWLDTQPSPPSTKHYPDECSGSSGQLDNLCPFPTSAFGCIHVLCFGG